jgi:hypothetical protein
MGFWKKGILLGWVIACLLSVSAFGGEKLISEVSVGTQTYISADQEGQIWAVYFDPRDGIHIRNAESGKDLLVSSGGEKSHSGLAFNAIKGHFFAAWREKAGGKKLFFRASHDDGKTLSETVLLDDGKTQALPRIEIGSNTKGNVAVEWLGETSIDGDKYHLYAACSNDFGKTFSKPENLTLGYDHSIYPAILVDDGGIYAFSYSYSTSRNERYIVFRKSVDGCKTWSAPLEIKKIGVVTLFVEPVRVGKRLHVIWFNSYEGVPVVEDAYSDDDGSTWKTTVLEHTRGFDTGLVRVAHDSRGDIYVALYGKKDTEKETVYFVRSEDNGATWSDMIPLRHYSSKDTKANNLIMKAEDDGTVIAVWRDYRNIRSNIYMQYSRDYGKTWQEKDVPLDEPGKVNTGFFQYTDDIVKVKDKYYLLAHRFRTDALTKADLILIDFSLEKGGHGK